MTITPIVINREDDTQPAASQQYITVLSYGDTRTGKTRFAATFPNTVVIADAGERGWDTIIHMPTGEFYHPGKAPLVLPVRDQAEMSAALTVVEGWVKAGLVDTVVIDSITFYAESWLQNTKRLFKGEPDNYALYGGLLDHLAFIRKLVHGWPCNVVWLALAAPPENKPKRQGGPLLPGQSRDRFPPACQYCFYHLVWDATGDVEQPDGSMAKQSWLVYEARTQRWEDYLAGGRDNGRLPDPLHYPTYRMIAEHLGLPEFAPKHVPQDVVQAAFLPTSEPAAATAAASTTTTTKTSKATSTGTPPARRATSRSR